MRGFTALLALTLLTGTGFGQDFRSGLQPAAPGQPATKIPQPFDVHTFNGRNGNRFRCVVCENGNHPTLLLFLKVPPEGKEKAFEELFTKLDALVEKYEAMDKYPDVTTFNVYAIFVDPAAQTSLNNPGEADPAALVKEATDRRALFQKLKPWGEKAKKVVVGTVIPDKIKDYNINPAAALTGVYYYKLAVLENFAFEDFTEADIDPIIARAEMRLQEMITSYEARRKKGKGSRI